MSLTLQQFLDSEHIHLWIDDTAYIDTLLAKGQTPWLDVTAFIALKRTAQSLLKSDIIQLPIAPICQAWLQQHPELISQMASKKRIGFALKTLLADELLRQHLRTLVQTLKASFSHTALALQCPSPQAWLIAAYQWAHGIQDDATEKNDMLIDIEDDDIDSASVYIADFLRILGESELNILLLKESKNKDTRLDLYQPVLNVASHYAWDIALHCQSMNSTFTAPKDLFLISPHSTQCSILPEEYWSHNADNIAVAQNFIFIDIPAYTQPEWVLSCLNALRTQTA